MPSVFSTVPQAPFIHVSLFCLSFSLFFAIWAVVQRIPETVSLQMPHLALSNHKIKMDKYLETEYIVSLSLSCLIEILKAVVSGS